jgi:hypothetical protein
MDKSPEEQSKRNASGTVETQRSPRLRRCITFVIVGIPCVCVLLTGLSVLSNLILPAYLPATERLSELDKARLAEAIHLRRALGDRLWQGWSQADLPMIVYNEAYAFLVGYPNPPAGWVKVPGNVTRGGVWEAVSDDTFDGQAYYRQRLPNPGVTPEAFTVLVGDQWVSSLTSREWMEISMGNDFRNKVPPFMRIFFPYRLAGRSFLAAVGGKDWYIVAMLHESFHAFEGMSYPTRLAASETMFQENNDRYMWEDQGFRQRWQTELNLLADAVQAVSEAEALDLARQFLAQRQQRRAEFNMDADLIALESLKEWEEGLAKYTELSIWRLAAVSPDYRPLDVMENDTGFKRYTTAGQRWSQEIQQIRRMANDQGDGRFYYSGLAQAAILDRLMPDWRTKVMTEDVFLEDLLQAAVQ